MQLFVQQLINGLSLGAVYALIALGYTMVYGVLRLINFAHGDVYMVGAVTAWALATWLEKIGAPAWVVLPAVFTGSMSGCAVLGFVIEFFAYRPLRKRPRIVSLITAIGVSLFLENLFQQKAVFGPTPRTMPGLLQVRPMVGFHVGASASPVVINNLDVISFSLSLVLMAILTWVILKTRTGLALRAVSFRFDTAALMGVNTGRIISMTFMLGSALAAVAGVMDAIRYNVTPLMGLMAGLKAFVAAVVGGIGSIPGAVLGGLLIGMLEALLKGLILPPAYNGLADAAVFLVLIVILLVKPSGLLGQQVAEKV